MRKIINFSLVVILCSFCILPKVYSQRSMEKLNHGLLAVKTSSGVLVTWRVLASEWYDVKYNLYRDGVLVNDIPIDGASNILDISGTTNSTYTLKLVKNKFESKTQDSCSVWSQNYLDIPVRTIDVDGDTTLYALNDASVGDLDGDGEYEIVVKRLVANNDTSLTYFHYLEAYKLDGTFMWAVNMGPNIYDGVEFNFLVWDLDMDGKAEIALRTSDGFIDGEGTNIGDYDNDGIINYRYSVSTWLTTGGYRCEGPDYISILDGESGKQLAITDYIERGSADDWGKSGDGGHRATKCMFTVAYLDGKRPSFIVSRGIYERTAFAAWTYDNGTLTQNWSFDSDNDGTDYAGQGFHNLTLGDVDNDSRDELVYGSMVIDDDGSGLYSTGLGHGDAQHLADINPYRKGLEYFGCLEEYEGGSYRDASTGEELFYKNIGRDMGRAGCSDITPDYPGMEMWGPTGFPLLSSDGTEITDMDAPSSMNFFIWWDGDVTRELLDHEWNSSYGIGTIVKYDNGANTQLLYAEGTLSDNWTKGNPALSADILGDWREEVIWRTDDNTALRLYTTPYTTDKKIYTLMQDPQYRAAIGWQPNSYNQPPHPSFFIGTDMDSLAPAPILFDGLKVYNSGSWDKNTKAWYDDDRLTSFKNGDRVLFDISADTNEIKIKGEVSPLEVRVISPEDFTFSGKGKIGGSARLVKSGEGNLIIKTNNSYNGLTRVWQGQLTVDGKLLNSKVFVKRFAVLAGTGSMQQGVVIEPYAYFVVGDGEDNPGSVEIHKSLTLAESSIVKMDLSDNSYDSSSVFNHNHSNSQRDETENDIVKIIGDLNIGGEITLEINKLSDGLSAGTYTLMTFTGRFNGNVDDIDIDGISDIPASLEIRKGKLLLIIPETRDATTVVWQGEVDNAWDLYITENWLNNGESDYFIGNDSVIFDNTAIETTVEIIDEYTVGGVLFNADTSYTLEGEGSIAGESGLTKQGSGMLTISNSNSYTGPTVIENGVISVSTLSNGGYNSPIGASSADSSNLIINGGELEIIGTKVASTDHNLIIGKNNGTINVADEEGQLSLYGSLYGEGNLIKTGEGLLALQSASYHGGTIINGGTIELTEDEANISGLGDTLVFNGGILAMNDNKYSYTDDCAWNIVVPEGNSGTLNMDSRCSLTGSLTGSGTLNLYSPFVRCDLKGDWSAFTGSIVVTSDDDGGDFRIYNSYGYKNASVVIDGSLYTYNNTGSETSFGSLDGVEASTLAYGTWNVGYNNKDAVFNGYITGASIINKYGTGIWSLSDSNDYTGTTTVFDGTLNVTNTTGSATGSGDVVVYSALSGTGIINGNVILESGSSIEPGIDSIGTLTFGSGISFVKEGSLIIEVNGAAGTNDVVASSDTITLSGILQLDEINDTEFEAGDSFKIFDASVIEGSFDTIVPAIPGIDLIWNLTSLSSEGIISVMSSSELSTKKGAGLIEDILEDVNIYPNPTSNVVNISLTNAVEVKKVEVLDVKGRVVSVVKDVNNELMEIDMTGFSEGVYFIKILTKDGFNTYKLIKKNN